MKEAFVKESANDRRVMTDSGVLGLRSNINTDVTGEHECMKTDRIGEWITGTSRYWKIINNKNKAENIRVTILQ